jgi:zinc transport system substrate-binding protein
MKTGISRVLAIAAVCAILLSACGGQSNMKAADKEHNGLNIVTSFYPIYIATINVTKGISGVSVTNMTESATGCLHDYNLKTGDMKRLEGADIFAINGAGMESFMDKIVQQKPGLQTVDASRGITLLKNESTGGENAHVWVSVSGAVEQVRNIEEQLAACDPANARAYGSNAEAYVKKLEELEKRMHKELDSLKDRNIVTFHEAFTYFAREFGLNVSAVMELDPGSEPEAGELAALIDTVRKDKVRALFTEPQYASDIADVVAKETGAEVYVLDPVVTGKADGDADAYIKKMEENMKTLKEALNK